MLKTSIEFPILKTAVFVSMLNCDSTVCPLT